MKEFFGKYNGKIALIAFVLASFIGIAVVTHLFSTAELPIQITAVLLEAIITAVMTYFLLGGQTETEEVREKNVKVFEKKQEVYHEFLENLKGIIQDGKIIIATEGTDRTAGKSVDELKDLIFQLGYLQMHSKKETIETVLSGLSAIIKLLNNFSISGDKQAVSMKFYSDLSNELFKIVSALKADLYPDADKYSIAEKNMEDVLSESARSIETETANKHKIMQNFCDGLRKLLNAKENKDIHNDINLYYQHNGGHPVNIDVEVCKLKNDIPVIFRIRVHADVYYYGFWEDKNQQADAKLCVQESMQGCESNEAWYGYFRVGNTSKFPINFLDSTSAGFLDLKSSLSRELRLKEIAEDMKRYIEKFKEIAIKNNLINK